YSRPCAVGRCKPAARCPGSPRSRSRQTSCRRERTARTLAQGRLKAELRTAPAETLAQEGGLEAELRTGRPKLWIERLRSARPRLRQVFLADREQGGKSGLGQPVGVDQAAVREIVRLHVAQVIPSHHLHAVFREHQR